MILPNIFDLPCVYVCLSVPDCSKDRTKYLFLEIWVGLLQRRVKHIIRRYKNSNTDSLSYHVFKVDFPSDVIGRYHAGKFASRYVFAVFPSIVPGCKFAFTPQRKRF
jgi:hypothetical protein